MEGRNDRPPHLPLDKWLEVTKRDDTQGLALCVRVTARGMKSATLRALFACGQARMRPDEGGGVIEGTIPPHEVDWYAARLLAEGPLWSCGRRPNSSRPCSATWTSSPRCIEAGALPAGRPPVSSIGSRWPLSVA